MRIAVISDIHGNLEALTAVFRDIESHQVEAIHCLGDVIGYGCDPRACLHLVEENCDIKLVGNHEYIEDRTGDTWSGAVGPRPMRYRHRNEANSSTAAATPKNSTGTSGVIRKSSSRGPRTASQSSPCAPWHPRRAH